MYVCLTCDSARTIKYLDQECMTVLKVAVFSGVVQHNAPSTRVNVFGMTSVLRFLMRTT
jgi:hypothetical protein